MNGKLRINQAKRRLRAGETVICPGGSPISPSLVDLIGSFGFPAFRIDMEHGDVDYGDVPDLTRAADLWGMSTLVRTTDPDRLYRLLDQGALGVQIPHVSSAEQARAVVAAAKFHPQGARSIYSGRQSYGVSDYLARANEETMVVVSIEDMEAVRALPAILAVPGIDVFYVAPKDLGQSLGYLDPLHPDVQKILRETVATIVAAGRIAGTFSSPGQLREHSALGIRFLCMNWTVWIQEGARATTRLAADLQSR